MVDRDHRAPRAQAIRRRDGLLARSYGQSGTYGARARIMPNCVRTAGMHGVRKRHPLAARLGTD